MTLLVIGGITPFLRFATLAAQAGLALAPHYAMEIHLHLAAGREVVTVGVLKLAFMPVVAWLVGTALGLDGTVLLGVVMTAALPTAQNIFLHATRYRTGEDVAREAILVTTLASLPVALLVALLLG